MDRSHIHLGFSSYVHFIFFLLAFYGVLFKADEEAAFAVFHVWFPLGFALSFGYSAYFCTSFKIYLMMIICTLGFVGYVTVEILYRKNKTKKFIT
ncbi:UNVERIFIED_CONTAM: UNC93-like protein [Trichonephila clavipes]